MPGRALSLPVRRGRPSFPSVVLDAPSLRRRVFTRGRRGPLGVGTARDRSPPYLVGTSGHRVGVPAGGDSGSGQDSDGWQVPFYRRSRGLVIGHRSRREPRRVRYPWSQIHPPARCPVVGCLPRGRGPWTGHPVSVTGTRDPPVLGGPSSRPHRDRRPVVAPPVPTVVLPRSSQKEGSCPGDRCQSRTIVVTRPSPFFTLKGG